MKRKHEELDVSEDISESKLADTSTDELLQSYGATLSPNDKMIFEILKTRIVDPMPFFGPKALQPLPASAIANPLFAHTIKANTILASTIDVNKAYYTSLLYDPEKAGNTSASYDLSFLLPLLCHILDEKNVCDGVKVILHGWIFFIVRGMSLEDETLRAEAFLAFQLLIDAFERAKAKSKVWRHKDAKLYLHILNGIKRGIIAIGDCRISHVLSTWMVGIWEVLRQPSHLLFTRITTSLFTKPTIEMSIIPDFISFYNDGDERRESRTWMLTILYHGLKTLEDWRIARKSPVIKFLCCSFLLEKVKTQRTIVAILTHGSKIPEIAQEMTDKHSLPFWISNLDVTNGKLKLEIEELFHSLAANCPPSEFRNQIFNFVRRKRDWTEGKSNLEDVVEVKEENEDTEQRIEKAMEVDE